ncbi:hypothetical protein [Sorangium sp. So ce363]
MRIANLVIAPAKGPACAIDERETPPTTPRVGALERRGGGAPGGRP